MGNCCDETKYDNDVMNEKYDKKIKPKRTASFDIQNQTDNNMETMDIHKNNENQNINLSPKLHLSKNKLKLTIIQSKSLQEGKEYIINSFGLQDSKNDYKDGIVIFGDNNVSYFYNIFKNRLIQELISYSHMKRVIQSKIMLKSVMIKL